MGVWEERSEGMTKDGYEEVERTGGGSRDVDGRATVEESWLEGGGEYGWYGGEWSEGVGCVAVFKGKRRRGCSRVERNEAREGKIKALEMISLRHATRLLR